MIAPHIPFALKGVIWYQGESNSSRAKQYEHLFPMLVSSWRERWHNPNMSFYFVQIAGYDGKQSGEGA
jgi:sialate O-acetylesterase